MKRQKYGYIYKTHLFGNPTVRVLGAENVRQILLGENKLVAVQWPASVRTILGSDTLSNVHGSQHKNKKRVRNKRAYCPPPTRKAVVLSFPCWQRITPIDVKLIRNPCILQAIMKAFSREALEQYIPVIQEEVRSALRDWLKRDACVLVYPEMKRLMFRIAMRILLGFEPDQIKTDEQELVEAFEEMIKNLFSLPIDVPFSGLYRVSNLVFSFYR